MISVVEPIVGKDGNQKKACFLPLTNMGFRVTLAGFVAENYNSV